MRAGGVAAGGAGRAVGGTPGFWKTNWWVRWWAEAAGKRGGGGGGRRDDPGSCAYSIDSLGKESPGARERKR
jgi:hypothetical protein